MKFRKQEMNEFNGRKINVWSTNKFSNELYTAVSVAFSVPSPVQSKIVKNCSYSFTADPTKRRRAKGQPFQHPPQILRHYECYTVWLLISKEFMMVYVKLFPSNEIFGTKKVTPLLTMSFNIIRQYFMTNNEFTSKI